MSKRRIRVTLAGLLSMVTIVGIGVAVITLVILPRFGPSVWPAIVLAVYGGGTIVAVIVYPEIRVRRAREACISNLVRIEEAKERVRVDVGGTDALTPTHAQVADWLEGSRKCFCPLAKGRNKTFENSYAINDMASPPACKLYPNTHSLE
jgi:hypothetical protein